MGISGALLLLQCLYYRVCFCPQTPHILYFTNAIHISLVGMIKIVQVMSRIWPKKYTLAKLLGQHISRFQLKSDIVYFTKLLQCKLCWTAKSEQWPHTWFPWLQSHVEIYFSFCQFVVDQLHYPMKYQKPSVCTTYLILLLLNIECTCVECNSVCGCPYYTVDCQTETNHLTVVVIVYSKANFYVALRADLTITKIHC